MPLPVNRMQVLQAISKFNRDLAKANSIEKLEKLLKWYWVIWKQTRKHASTSKYLHCHKTKYINIVERN